MKIPYKGIELKLAIMALDENKLTEESGEKVNAVGVKYHITDDSSTAELNKAVAEDNGITVETLVNSPNMSKMVSDYTITAIHEIVGVMEEDGLTNKEAWAIISVQLGLLND